jgi:hypothetical protein
MLDRGLARSCKFVLKDQIAGTGANLREKSATISNLGNKLLEVQAERSLLSNQVFRPHSWILVLNSYTQTGRPASPRDAHKLWPLEVFSPCLASLAGV